MSETKNLVRPECRRRLAELLAQETITEAEWEEIYELLTPQGRMFVVTAIVGAA